MSPVIAIDETVRVLEGAFAGFAGRVRSVDPQAGTAVVNVRIFGRATPVEVPVDALEHAEVRDRPTLDAYAPIDDPTAMLDEE